MKHQPESAAPPIPTSAWKVLAVTGLGMFLVGLDVSIVSIAFPSLRSDFGGTTTSSLSWVLTAYSIVYAGLLIVSGRMADRIGRRRLFMAGLAVFVLGSVAVALAPSIELLVAMRGLQGVGAAMMTPSSMGLVLAAWPPQRRATAVALWGAVFAVAVAVGPSLGALLIEGASWRWAFLINLPIGVAALLWSRSVLQESELSPLVGSPDLVGAVIVTTASVAATLGIVQGRDWGWTSLPVLSSFAIAAAALGAFIHRTKTHRDPIVPAQMFAIGSFRYASLALFVFSLGFFAFFLSMVLFLTDVWGYSILKAGLAITGGPATVAIAAVIGGRVADRLGHRAVVVPGTLFHAAGVAWWLWRLGPEPQFVTDWLPGLVLAGAGIGLTLGILAAAGVSEVAPEHFSLAGAVTQTGRQLGGAIGLAIMVAILGDPDDLQEALDRFDTVFAYIIAMSLTAAIIATRIRPTKNVVRSGEWKETPQPAERRRHGGAL